MKFCTLCRRAAPAGSSICSFDGHPLTEDAPVDQQPGITIGGYRLNDVAAQGDTGTVYRAEGSSGSRVALKLLDKELCATAAVMHRVRRETKNAIKLANPNVARVLDCGDHDGRFFVVREWLDGHPLSVMLSEEGSLSIGRATAVAYQIAAALGLVHRVGLVHRDLKPNHVFVAQTSDGSWTVKLIDIGLAAKIEGVQLARDVFGTANYLSPEQSEGKLVSFRSDLYSLGVIYHEMLTGSPPFTGDPMATIEAHKKTPPPAIGDMRPDLPEPLAQLITKLLAKQASARPFSAAMVQRELERVLPECKDPLAPVVTGRGGVKASTRPSSASVSSQPQASAEMGMAATLFGGTVDAAMAQQAAAQGESTVRDPDGEPLISDTQPMQAAPQHFAPGIAAKGGAKQTILGLPVVTAEQLAARQAPEGSSPPPTGPASGVEISPELGGPMPSAVAVPMAMQPAVEQSPRPASSASAQPSVGGYSQHPGGSAQPVGASPYPGQANPATSQGGETVRGMGPAPEQPAQAAYPQSGPTQQPPTTDELRQELKRGSTGKLIMIGVIVLVVVVLAVVGGIFALGRSPAELEPAPARPALLDVELQPGPGAAPVAGASASKRT